MGSFAQHPSSTPSKVGQHAPSRPRNLHSGLSSHCTGAIKTFGVGLVVEGADVTGAEEGGTDGAVVGGGLGVGVLKKFRPASLQQSSISRFSVGQQNPPRSSP